MECFICRFLVTSIAWGVVDVIFLFLVLVDGSQLFPHQRLFTSSIGEFLRAVAKLKPFDKRICKTLTEVVIIPMTNGCIPIHHVTPSVYILCVQDKDVNHGDLVNSNTHGVDWMELKLPILMFNKMPLTYLYKSFYFRTYTKKLKFCEMVFNYSCAYLKRYFQKDGRLWRLLFLLYKIASSKLKFDVSFVATITKLIFFKSYIHTCWFNYISGSYYNLYFFKLFLTTTFYLKWINKIHVLKDL